MTPESRLLAEIRNALNRLPHVRAFRNNCGVLRDEKGRYVRYGIPGNGGSDLLGWVTRGGVAVVLAIEVKTATGRLTPEQANWLRVVTEAGGVAGCVRSADEAVGLVEGDKL